MIFFNIFLFRNWRNSVHSYLRHHNNRNNSHKVRFLLFVVNTSLNKPSGNRVSVTGVRRNTGDLLCHLFHRVNFLPIKASKSRTPPTNLTLCMTSSMILLKAIKQLKKMVRLTLFMILFVNRFLPSTTNKEFPPILNNCFNLNLRKFH